MSQTEKKRSSRSSVIDNQPSRHTSKHSQSSYGGSISDIETDESDKYRKMAKKLSRDKSELKDKLRRLLDEVDQKNREHRIELEKTQDYFQDQINELVEERDRAREEIAMAREVTLEEKDRIREQYEQKLSKQKETLEKRYGGKDSQVVKRLENTIATLQTRLNKQIEEREHVKDTTEQFYAEKEEQLRKTVTELEDQLQKVKDMYTKERRDLQMVSKTFADEKEHLIRQLKHEKDEEIAQIVAEKNNTINNLQNAKVQIEKRNENLDRRRDTIIAQAKQEAEQARINYERKHNEFVQNSKKSFEDFKQESERKLAAAESKNSADMERLMKEHEKIIQNLSSENSRKIDVYADNVRREVEEYKKNIASLQAELSTLNERYTTTMQKKEEELRKNIEKCNAEYRGAFEEKNKEINELRLKNDKISGESEETIQQLKDQVTQLRENLRKAQESAHAMNTQFVINLNKQKDLAEKEILARDQLIGQLEYKIRKITDDSMDKFAMLDRKAKNILEEHKDAVTRYNNAKVLLDKNEQTISTLVGENSKLKEAMLCIQEQYRQAQFNGGMAEQKIKADMEHKKQEVDNMVKSVDELKNKINILTNTCGQQQTQLKTATETIEKHVQTLNARDKEIATMSKDLSFTTGELNRLKKVYVEELQTKLQEFKTDRDRQVAELTTRLASLDNVIKNLEQSRADMRENIVTVGIERDKYKAIADMSVERDKSLESAVKKIANLDTQLHNMEQNKQQLEHKIQLLQDKHKGVLESLAEKHKQNTETLSKELELRGKEIQKLQEEINSMKNNGTAILTNITAGNKAKENEIKQLKDKLNEYQGQEAKLSELSNALSTTQHAFRNLSTKMTEEKNLEVGKLNKKIIELENQLLQTEQKAEKAHQEFNKKLLELSKSPPEDKVKLQEIEKEYTRLSDQLVISEKKLSALQAEYAQAVASIKTKQDHLKEREEELKRAEKALRESPPKLMDPTIRKARDDALTNLRQAKIELTKTKDETIQVTQKLMVAEGLIKDLEREKHLILKSQSDLKETFVNSLNQQQEKHEKELVSKSERIKELETMLTEKLK